MKNYFYFLFSGLPAGNAHRGTMKNYFYILFFGLPARVAHRGTQKIFLRASRNKIVYAFAHPAEADWRPGLEATKLDV